MGYTIFRHTHFKSQIQDVTQSPTVPSGATWAHANWWRLRRENSGSVQAERSWCPSFASAANAGGQRVTGKGADARVERGPSKKITTGCNMTNRYGLMGYGLAHTSPISYNVGPPSYKLVYKPQ